MLITDRLLLLPVVPHILHILVLLQHIQKLGHAANVIFVGHGNIVLRYHLDLSALEGIALLLQRFHHIIKAVGIGGDLEHGAVSLHVLGACCGTSTVTTFVESSSGVEAGGRTGLTSLTSAFMFLACMFIAPIAAIIPAAATSSALIYVGILMLQGLKNVDFNDMDQIVPVFIMLLAMPISGSIGHGIGLAMISYTVIKVFSGKAKEVSTLTYVITALFLIKFFAVV